LIRIPNLRWGLPEVEEEALPVRKAFEMWGWDQGHLTLDAQTAGWPSLSFYVQLALQKLQYTIGRLTGRYDGPLDFFVEHAELATLMPAARFLSIGLALAVVVIGVRLALRLAGWFGALTTGLVLCLSPLLIEQSIKVTPDILLTLFSALALGSFLDVYERGRHRDYVASAVWIGLGVASKYTPVLLLPCLLAAHLARPAAIPFWRRIFDGRLLLAGVVCAATCFAASPFTFLNLAAAQRDMPLQFMHVVSSGHFGHELQQKGHVFYMVTVLPEALGWPALVLGVTGLVLAAWRKRGAWIVVLLSFACYYAGLGALRSLHAHYMLPSLLSLALGLAGLAGELERVTAVRGRRWFVAGASGLLALIGCPLAALSARELLRYSRPSTLQESKRFIMEELNRPDATFACEVGGPNLPRSPEADFAHRPVFRRLDAPSRERLLSRPFVHRFVMYMYMTEANRSDVYYDLRHYVNYDYIIVSGTAYHRYVGMAETYPRQNAFYQDLERYGELVRYFPESKDRIGPNVWIYRVGSRMRQILEDRGRLARGFHAAYLAKVRREDLHAFLGFTGDLAARKEDWQSADLYLSTLLDLRPEIRDELLLTVAHAKYKAGNFIEAAELCAERLRHHPGDLKAQALGAAIVKGSAAALPGEHGL
jgi:tetratricopeptide (TPR) repeat protein